jgi:hypothetical protein
VGNVIVQRAFWLSFSLVDYVLVLQFQRGIFVDMCIGYESSFVGLHTFAQATANVCLTNINYERFQLYFSYQ